MFYTKKSTNPYYFLIKSAISITSTGVCGNEDGGVYVVWDNEGGIVCGGTIDGDCDLSFIWDNKGGDVCGVCTIDGGCDLCDGSTDEGDCGGVTDITSCFRFRFFCCP